MPTKASPWRICGNAGNGILCATIRDFKKFLPAPSPPLRPNNGPLLFVKLRFLQQESLHIGEDKARVECAGTVNVPDATFAIDYKDAQGVIKGTLWRIGRAQR